MYCYNQIPAWLKMDFNTTNILTTTLWKIRCKQISKSAIFLAITYLAKSDQWYGIHKLWTPIYTLIIFKCKIERNARVITPYSCCVDTRHSTYLQEKVTGSSNVVIGGKRHLSMCRKNESCIVTEYLLYTKPSRKTDLLHLSQHHSTKLTCPSTWLHSKGWNTGIHHTLCLEIQTDFCLT